MGTISGKSAKTIQLSLQQMVLGQLDGHMWNH